MAPDAPLLYRSGDLSIRPDLGEIRSSSGESVRFGPVNMQVLALLIHRKGDVVSRTEIFDAVWKNQIVADDVLTRCVSDIRAELRRLSGRDGHIETLPKRGYRWAPAVTMSPFGAQPDAAPTAEWSLQSGFATWAKRLIGYAVALVVLATTGAWLIRTLVVTSGNIIAILPVTAEPDRQLAAHMLGQSIRDFLRNIEGVELLSPAAIESRPGNPYPFFRREFGARWVLEGELRHMADGEVLTLDLVDARNGLESLHVSLPIGIDGDGGPLDVQPALSWLEAAIASVNAP